MMVRHNSHLARGTGSGDRQPTRACSPWSAKRVLDVQTSTKASYTAQKALQLLLASGVELLGWYLIIVRQ